MSRIGRIFRMTAVLLCILSVSVLAGAQDLGSTSGLFSTKRTKKSTVKKAKSKKPASKKSKSSKTTKRRTTAKKSSKKTSPKSNQRSANAADSSSKTQSTTRNVIASSKSDSKNTSGPNDVVITIGTDKPNNFVELFDDSIASGNAARNRRLYMDAETAYSKAHSIDPSDSRAVYGLGNVYSDQQRWEEAEGYYRRALVLDPESAMANIALSFVLTQPVVGSNVGKRYAEAEKVARKAISLDSDNPIGYDQLGVALELRGIISAETENAYRKAIDLDPTFALAYSHLGRLLRRNGRTNESSSAYRDAIKLAADVPTMILVADVMQSQQRYLDSEQLLREALRRDPRNPTGLYLLGRALTTRRSFGEAEDVLKKSVDVSPNSFVSYALLGSLYSRSGDLAKAEQTLIQALSVVTDNEKRRLAQEFEEVGDNFVKKFKYQDAARVFRRAVALDSAKASLTGKLADAESQK